MPRIVPENHKCPHCGAIQPESTGYEGPFFGRYELCNKCNHEFRIKRTVEYGEIEAAVMRKNQHQAGRLALLLLRTACILLSLVLAAAWSDGAVKSDATWLVICIISVTALLFIFSLFKPQAVGRFLIWLVYK